LATTVPAGVPGLRRPRSCENSLDGQHPVNLFVPGRICLFGEHSDWAGGYRRVNPALERGYTLICGTEQGIHATVKPHPDALLLTATTPQGEQRGPFQIPMEPGALLAEAQSGGFWSYIAGVAYQARTHFHVGGLVVDNYRTDLPIKKGLSSSAAICVLVARAFNRLYDLKLTVRGEMELAYQGEVTTPSRCGRMDQGCAFGSRPVLMAFDGDFLDTQEVVASADLHLVVADLQGQKDTVRILADLNRAYPCAETEVARSVQSLLGPLNRRLVHQAVRALEAGNAQDLGALMREAQTLFDRYAAPACPEQLPAPVLHRALDYGPLQAHVWGGKGVGSQGDGSAQFVARSPEDQQAAIEILQRDLGMPCLALTLRASPPGRGAATRPQPDAASAVPVAYPTGRGSRRLRTAVVPAAGLGTRLFPATKAIKKEFFPLVDRDGLAKPTLLVIIEEALEAGIEEVIVVVQGQDLDAVEAVFRGRDPAPADGRLPPALRSYARHIVEMGRHVSFAVQPEQAGFGHAVACAHQAVGDEPFLLMLGDHVYRARGDRSCARQMLDAFHEQGRSVLGLRPVPEAEVMHYGVAVGTWLRGQSLLRVDGLAEKPTRAQARAHLRMAGLPEGSYLAFFGQYALEPEVFEYLEEEMEATVPRPASDLDREAEIQLTPALGRLQRERGVFGLVVDGQCYDIGRPETYLRTLCSFAG
jgi:UTP-glucose-1-phosphate uridylyltransferase/mevalonate kinase